MKSKLLLAVLLCYGLYAQGQRPPKLVRLGLKAGISGSLFTRNVAPFDGGYVRQLPDYRRFFRPSGFGGLTADFQVSPRFMIGTELLFNSRGMVYREKNDAVVIIDDEGYEQQAYNRYNYNIDYFELPLTLNYNLRASNTWLVIYGGIAPAMATNYKTKLYYEESTRSDGRRAQNVRERLDYVRKINNNAIAGVKVGDDTGDKVAAYADFRLSHTLRPVFNRSTNASGYNLHTQMFTFSASVGFRF